LKDFFKTFIVYGLATFIDKLVVLFFIPVYAKHLTVQEFGNMDLVQSIISIVSIFVFLQLEASLQRYFYEFDEKRLKLFASTIIYFVAILSVILILLFMAISFFSNSSAFLQYGHPAI
jgi:O-antigen/teichoic acid export membrane protein